jgi:hypothetical protein
MIIKIIKDDGELPFWFWELYFNKKFVCEGLRYTTKRPCVKAAKRMCSLLLPACKVMFNNKIIYELS